MGRVARELGVAGRAAPAQPRPARRRRARRVHLGRIGPPAGGAPPGVQRHQRHQRRRHQRRAAGVGADRGWTGGRAGKAGALLDRTLPAGRRRCDRRIVRGAPGPAAAAACRLRADRQVPGAGAVQSARRQPDARAAARSGRFRAAAARRAGPLHRGDRRRHRAQAHLHPRRSLARGGDGLGLPAADSSRGGDRWPGTAAMSPIRRSRR